MNLQPEQLIDSVFTDEGRLRWVFEDASSNTAISMSDLPAMQTIGKGALPFDTGASFNGTILMIDLTGSENAPAFFVRSNPASAATIQNLWARFRTISHGTLGDVLALAPGVMSRFQKIPHQEIDWAPCLSGYSEDEIEDGMTADLGERISRLVQQHGTSGIKSLGSLLESKKVAPVLVSHILRWVGRIKNPPSFEARFNLLVRCLRSPSTLIRDGASLGLGLLGSARAIPFLTEAIGNEKLPALRSDMEQVVRELRN